MSISSSITISTTLLALNHSQLHLEYSQLQYFIALESEEFWTSLWLSHNSFNWKTFCFLFVTSANAWHIESTQIIVAQKVNELCKSL